MSRIVWAEPALHDLQAIHDFLARDSKPYATLLLERIFLAVDQLEKFPLIGRAVPRSECRCASFSSTRTASCIERAFSRGRLPYNHARNRLYEAKPGRTVHSPIFGRSLHCA